MILYFHFFGADVFHYVEKKRRLSEKNIGSIFQFPWGTLMYSEK